MVNSDTDKIQITIDHSLKLNHAPADLLEALVERFQMLNPKWLENERMGRWNRGTKKILRFYRRLGKDAIINPRGYARQLIFLLKQQKNAYAFVRVECCFVKITKR